MHFWRIKIKTACETNFFLKLFIHNFETDRVKKVFSYMISITVVFIISN